MRNVDIFLRNNLEAFGEGDLEKRHTAIATIWETYICMKKIGFLSFGHWTRSPQSRTQSATDALLQSIDLAVEAERLGMDGAYFRVHHFAQLPTMRMSWKQS